jgi:hypothetical protein
MRAALARRMACICVLLVQSASGMGFPSPHAGSGDTVRSIASTNPAGFASDAAPSISTSRVICVPAPTAWLYALEPANSALLDLTLASPLSYAGDVDKWSAPTPGFPQDVLMLYGDCWLVASRACIVSLPGKGGAPLATRIADILAAVPTGSWAVFAKDLTSGETIAMHADERLHPGSMIKIAVGMATLKWLDEHPAVTLVQGPKNGKSFGHMLRSMLVQSGESATSILQDFLATQSGYDMLQLLRAWGLSTTSTQPRRSSAHDLGLLLEHIYAGDLLSHSSGELLLGYLRTPTQDDRFRIPGSLPPCARGWVAHKSGTTFETGVGVVGDAGLVVMGDRAIVIVVVGNHVWWKDYDVAQQAISDVAAAVLEAWANPALGKLTPVLAPSGPTIR